MSKSSSGSSSAASSARSRADKSAPRRKDNVGAGQASNAGHTSVRIDADTRRAMIAEAAYYRAERRGFAAGFDVEDWLVSENELETRSPTQIERESLEKSSVSGSELH